MPPTQNGTLTPQGWLQWIAVIGIAAAMGVGGAYLVPQMQPSAVRPDPFTGTNGREMRDELLQRIAQVDAEGSRPVRALSARVDALEHRNAETIERLRRIEELLIELRVRLGVVTPKGMGG